MALSNRLVVGLSCAAAAVVLRVCLSRGATSARASTKPYQPDGWLKGAAD